MKKYLLLFGLLSAISAFSQTKNIAVDYNTVIGVGKAMAGVNTGPHSIVSGTTEQCLSSIGNKVIRTHDYHGPCDYWQYTTFYNYFNQSFNYNFQSHKTSDYNWTTTDAQIAEIINAGFQPFFRVGISFPGGGPSPATPMPKDADGINFRTFAGIAKRTAMHYTAGWNNGFSYTIPYWEIWNEPNNNASWTVDSVQAYYRLYKQCVDSLKSFNPSLKVGGPGTAKNAFYTGGIRYSLNHNYVSNFFNYCKNNQVPIDFYSFHMYDKRNPYNLKILSDSIRFYLDKYGFSNTELVISETNINTGGYDNTSKGCSYLTSELISLYNSTVSKLIWYRGVDLNKLCNSDSNSIANLTLNGYAYKFFNEVNDSTPVILNSTGNEFSSTNINDSLNNLMILAGKRSDANMVKVLISNHESIYSNLNISLQNLPWNSNDYIAIKTESINSSGYNTSIITQAGASTMDFNISNVSDANVFLITFEKVNPLLIENNLNSKHFIYPNPAQSTVHVNTDFINFDLTLRNVLGETLVSQQNNSTLNLQHIPNGVYYITLQSEGKTIENFKLMISK